MFTAKELRKRVKGPKKIVVANPMNLEVLQAIDKAQKEGIVFPLLVGPKEKIQDIASRHSLVLEAEFVDIVDTDEIIKKSTALVKEDNQSILMKGFIDSSKFLGGILRELSSRQGKLMSHIAYFDLPNKPLLVTDAAININPDLDKKVKIIANAIDFAKKIGQNEPPLVACCAAIEKVNTAMPCTIDAAILSSMNQRKQIEGCIIDGPLGLDNAIDKRAAEIKELDSPVSGNADIIIAPNIEAANFLYKSLAFLAKYPVGALVWGTTNPVILNSRADSMDSKYLSILLALNI